MYFEIDKDQQKRVDEWFAALQKRLIAEGKVSRASFAPDDNEHVYYGAIGGGLTFSFTPTGIGTVVTVTEAISGEKLDLTDYDSW